MALPELPVTAVLDTLRDTLAQSARAVLQAPPGAGKTTLVPLTLLDAEWLGSQRIVLLEPRRLAARAAARRMASLLGEEVGGIVGFRVRRETKVSARTRIEVVTEGILTRMMSSDPTLDGVGCVIFDEFHERSLQADVGLALALYSQELVRPELRLLVMSATLASERIAAVMGRVPIIRSEGRAYPVTLRYRPPRDPSRIDAAVAATVREAVQEHEGDILVFLPGQGEIARMVGSLNELPPSIDLHPLFGNLSAQDQDRAIHPAPRGRRKVILATSIAESSLTIDGVQVVVDSGRARVPRYSPRTGMTRLDTVRVSGASADQRAGRAGRLGPGFCYRIGSEEEQSHLLPFSTPEILDADLAPLALDLAACGITDVATLRWVDPPPAGPYARALEVLRELGALDHDHRLTPHGRALAALGTHPRFAQLLVRSNSDVERALACDLVALMEERDPLRSAGPPGQAPHDADLRLRLEVLRTARRGGPVPPVVAQMYTLPDVVRRMAQSALAWRRIMKLPDRVDWVSPDDAGRLLALAWPDRLAQRRSSGRFVLRQGTGASLQDSPALSQAPWLAVAETDGRAGDAGIRLGCPLDDATVRALFSGQMTTADTARWDAAAGKVRVTREERLGALLLRTQTVVPEAHHVREALREAAAAGSLRPEWTSSATALRERLGFLHAHLPDWPDVSDAAIDQRTAAWLDQHTDSATAVVPKLDAAALLLDGLDWKQRAQLDAQAPTHYVAPTGSRLPIDYADPAAPVIRVRLQEMFGLAETPTVLDGRVPLMLHLLSPAHRPMQITRDLAGFWTSSYADVKREMKGRYPRHEWPDDPRRAAPTRRTKPR